MCHSPPPSAADSRSHWTVTLRTAVTNAQFQQFVRDTGYKTEAELFEWSFVMDYLASDEVIAQVDGPTGYGRVKEAPHWMAVPGAYWRRPEGRDSSLHGRGRHPVVHISYNDSKAYCEWAGELPRGPHTTPSALSCRVSSQGGGSPRRRSGSSQQGEAWRTSRSLGKHTHTVEFTTDE